MARLKDYYSKTVVPALIKEFNYKNPMQVPKMEKIVINMGLGEAIPNVKIIDGAVQEIGCDYRAKTDNKQGKEIHSDV